MPFSGYSVSQSSLLQMQNFLREVTGKSRQCSSSGNPRDRNCFHWVPEGAKGLSGETEIPFLEGSLRIHGYWDRVQSSNSTGAWTGPTCWSWRVSWGVEVALAHCGDKNTGSGNIHQHELPWRLSVWYQDLAPLNSL